MKAIIIYYSLEGNTRFAANELARLLDADILELVPQKPVKSKGFSKYIWGGRQVVMNSRPGLLPYAYDSSKYQLTILASPIWASSFAPAISTFLDENRLEGDLALLCCHEGGGTQRAYDKITNALPECRLVSTLDLLSPLKNKEEAIRKIEQFQKTLK